MQLPRADRLWRPLPLGDRPLQELAQARRTLQELLEVGLAQAVELDGSARADGRVARHVVDQRHLPEVLASLEYIQHALSAGRVRGQDVDLTTVDNVEPVAD